MAQKKKSFTIRPNKLFLQENEQCVQTSQTCGFISWMSKVKNVFFAWIHGGKIKQTLVAILSGFGLNLKGSFSPPIKEQKCITQPNLTITNFVFQQN